MEILKKKIPFKCPKTSGVTVNAYVHRGHLSGKKKEGIKIVQSVPGHGYQSPKCF